MLSSQNVKNAVKLRPNKSTGLALLQRVEWVNLTYLVTFCEDDICPFFCDLFVQGERRSADFQRILHPVGCFWGRVTILVCVTQVTVQGQLALSEKLIHKNKLTDLKLQVCYWLCWHISEFQAFDILVYRQCTDKKRAPINIFFLYFTYQLATFHLEDRF